MPDQSGKIQREDWYLLIAIIVGGLLFIPLLKGVPFAGWDWMTLFSQRMNDADYPPWIPLLLRPLTALPPRTGLLLMQGLALSSVSLLTYRIARQTFPESRLPAVFGAVFAAVSPPVLIILWLGQVESLVLIGIVLMPFGIPLLFTKPNVGPWIVFRSRRDILWTVGVVLGSFVIWGFWPAEQFYPMVTRRTHHIAAMGWKNTHPLVGVLGVLMFLFTDRDQWRLMAAGSLVMPYIMPYHYYMFLPALGRVGGWRQVLLWFGGVIVGTIGMNANTVGSKMLALLFPILIWALLAPSLRLKDLWNDPDLIWRRGIRFTGEVWTHLRNVYVCLTRKGESDEDSHDVWVALKTMVLQLSGYGK